MMEHMSVVRVVKFCLSAPRSLIAVIALVDFLRNGVPYNMFGVMLNVNVGEVCGSE